MSRKPAQNGIWSYIDLGVLIGGLILTLGAWKLTDQYVKSYVNRNTEVVLEQVELGAKAKLGRYSTVLEGLRGFVEVRGGITEDEFQNYITKLSILEQNRGLYGFSYVERVNEMGGEKYLVKYVRVRQGKEAVRVGYDMKHDPVRGVVLDTARDSGVGAISPTVNLEGARMPGFIVSIPIFKKGSQVETLEQRRNSLVGFINSAFVYEDLVNEVFNENLHGVKVVALKNNQGEAKFDVDKTGSEVEITRDFSINGNTWSVDYLINPVYDQVWKDLPLGVMTVGIICSFLLFILVYSLSGASVRAEGLAREMTDELRKYKLAVDNTSEHVVITDQNGRLLYANDAVERITGFSREEIINQTPALWGRQMPKAFYEWMWDTIKNKKQTFRGELVNKRKNGEVYSAQVSISPILNDDGDVKYFVGIERDISVEKKFTENLKREKDLAQGIVGTMGEGLLVIDENKRIVIMNRAAEEMLGIKPGDGIARDWTEVVKAYGEDGKELLLHDRSFMEVLESGKQVVTELKDGHYYKDRHGRLFPIMSVTSYLPGVGVIKVFRDATLEKQEELRLAGALKHEQAQSQSVLENMGEGVVLTDTADKVTYVNSAFEDMLGFINREVQGKVFADMFRAFDLNDKPLSLPRADGRKMDGGADNEIKVQLMRKDGDKLAALINTSPVKQDGKVNGFVRVVHDFSGDLALQKQKDDFFSIASHELRTPLTVISGNLDTVLQGYGKSQLTEDDRQLLKDSEEAGDRLIAMVNNFLNVSRLDQGRIVVNTKSVDACSLVSQIVEEMRPLMETKGLRLSHSCETDLKNVMADEILLREIIVNLIGNSFKFTQAGHINIEVFNRDNWVVMRIEDSGIGIAQNKQGLLFKRFQQAMERTLTREAGGTGLGLYISREFARKMNGDLRLVSSEVGKGSVFEIVLPGLK